jgi:hypothetical protein
MKSYIKRCAVVLATVAVLAACSGGYQRGIFQGYVIDATEEEITNKIGKPDTVDNSKPEAPRWVYNKKTFDPDNMNQVDTKTIVVMKKDAATGKWKGAEVTFQ